MSTILEPQSQHDKAAMHARAQYKSGWSLPAYHYLSQECFQNEMATLKETLWLLAGHESQIPKTGDYKLFTFAQESIILVRDKTGAVNAFYNVCRHRGSIICRESQGNAKMLVCPYHAWAFKLDGTLIPPRSMPADFNPAEYSLIPCHLRLEDGMMFLSLATGTPPDFEAFMSPIRPFLRPYAIGRTKAVAEEHSSTSSNWKVALANAVECYHCPNAHRSMARIIQVSATGTNEVPDEKGETWFTRMQRLGRYVDPLMDDASSAHLRSAFQTPFQPGFVSGSMDGGPVGKLLGDMTEWTGGWVFLSFNPFVHAALFDDYVHLFYYTPVEAGKTAVTLLWLVRDDAVEGDHDIPALSKLMSLVISEDNEITDGNQRGIASCAYMPTPLSIEEDRVTLFHDWYVRHFLDAANSARAAG